MKTLKKWKDGTCPFCGYIMMRYVPTGKLGDKVRFDCYCCGYEESYERNRERQKNPNIKICEDCKGCGNIQICHTNICQTCNGTGIKNKKK